MTVTRTQAGKTPKKTEHPGYVQTPGTYKRTSRKSGIPSHKSDESDAPESTGAEDSTVETAAKKSSRRKSTKLSEDVKENGQVDDIANGSAKGPKTIDGWRVGTDPKIDSSGHFEFGGSLGTGAMMICFPALMYYMWIGATYYQGKFPMRAQGESFSHFVRHLGHLVYTGAYPSAKAWTMYWTFFIFEGALYCLAPGVWTKGKPLPHDNFKRLDYYCSGLWSWWITITIALALHFSGVFRLYTIMDEFGPLLSVAIISGFLVSIVAYASALHRGKQHRMTGSPVYDFFMGAELNPRMFGILDFKMFFEVRLPWFILFLLNLGACARQYEIYGYVSGNLLLLLMAFFLYANACAKGEECIVSTWDMYYEKWGFMLIFWNLAGVPFTYCHCTIYMANHAPETYEWNKYAMVILFTVYLFMYWIWDTTNSQKNRFRAQEQGGIVDRKAFPQLPWQTVKNPKVIRTEDGGTILADGWCKYNSLDMPHLANFGVDGKARKIHYTCDLFFALSWGAVTNFSSPFPWFYPLFFACMITHRAIRDIQKCRRRYGKAWIEYEKQVPYLFIPVSTITSQQ